MDMSEASYNIVFVLVLHFRASFDDILKQIFFAQKLIVVSLMITLETHPKKKVHQITSR